MNAMNRIDALPVIAARQVYKQFTGGVVTALGELPGMRHAIEDMRVVRLLVAGWCGRVAGRQLTASGGLDDTFSCLPAHRPVSLA